MGELLRPPQNVPIPAADAITVDQTDQYAPKGDRVENHVEATDGHPETDAPHEFQPE